MTYIVSLVLSCFFKLMIAGCTSSKDPFDEEDFCSGIYNFQKSMILIRMIQELDWMKLPRQNYLKYQLIPQMQIFFNVKTVVKSIVQDIAGKGNLMHLLSIILTTDLGTFTKHIHGGKLAIIWKNNNRTSTDLSTIKKRDFTEYNFNHGDIENILHQRQLISERRRFKNTSQLRNISEQYLSSNYDSNLSMKALFDNTEYPLNYSHVNDEYLS